MQTKFDIGEVAYIPVRVLKATFEGSAYNPEYRVCPLGKSPEFTMTYMETKLFSKEDIINKKWNDILQQTTSNGGENK